MQATNSQFFSGTLTTIILIIRKINNMVAYYVAHLMHIACACMSKPFPTLTINDNNYLYCNIIIYKLDILIDVVILKILI